MLCAMYTIKRAAELTGVPAATLRAWERRYGLGQPTRTDSGYRLYDERALADIRAMQLLLDAGWAPRQAAAEVIRLGGHVGPALAPQDLSSEPGEYVASRSIDSFLAAAVSMNDFAMRSVLDEGLGRAPFEAAFDNWLAPALRALGDAWVAGRVEIAAEHFASAAVMRRLSAAYESAVLVHGAPRVLVGLAPGAFHELGALAFATACRRAGLGAIYVGADLPADAWVAALAQEPVDAIALSVISEAEVSAARALVERIRASHPAVVISVGGPQSLAFADVALATPNGIADAVRQLSDALRKPSQRTKERV
jgi:methylmalonyl-CoA mutase cobalamin-binding subunit